VNELDQAIQVFGGDLYTSVSIMHSVPDQGMLTASFCCSK
jgi:hypothetical protein